MIGMTLMLKLSALLGLESTRGNAKAPKEPTAIAEALAAVIWSCTLV